MALVSAPAALGGVPLLSACGGGSSGLSGDQGGGGASTGARPTISQWYHQYGEAGTQQAVTRYAKEYPDATVKVQWTPGDYTSKLNIGLLSSSGPDVFESRSTWTRSRVARSSPWTTSCRAKRRLHRG